MSYRRKYWLECVEIALSDAGVTATQEQIEMIADAVEGGHECYGMATGDDVASANLHASNERERDQLKKSLAFEREKHDCPTCRGSGRERYNAGVWAVDTQCGKGHGEGKLHPSGRRVA